MSYSQLRQTQAELDEKARATRPPGHAPSNIASLKLEQASPPPERTPARTAEPPTPPTEPEPAWKRAAVHLSASPNDPMTSTQVASYNRTAGIWDEQQAKIYVQQRAADTPNPHNLGRKVNEDEAANCWKHAIASEAKAMTPEQVAERLRGMGREQTAERFERQQQQYGQMSGHGQEREKHRQDNAVEVVSLAVKVRARDARVQMEQQRINGMARHGNEQERQRSRGR